MEILTGENIGKIRERAKEHPEFLEAILESTADIRRKLYIQETGISTWTHYYVCPRHGVQLKFNYDDPEHHVCPIDGEVFVGEPYYGAWWMTATYRTATAAFKLAIAELIDGGKGYGEVVKSILLGYAKNYKNYGVHGGIPYNKPGRFGSQVLNDASILVDLGRAYGILRESFDAGERRLIEEELLRPAAAHQMKYFTDQLHNHEVHVATSIGVVGLALGDEELLEFAVNRKYGLKYQIDHGFLEDGFWFEGATGYHLYTLLAIIDYESAARNTKYSLFADPHYRERVRQAIRFTTVLLRSDGFTASLNDGGNSIAGTPSVFEYGYSYFGDEEIGQLLAIAMRGKRRDGTEALIYGADEIPELRPIVPKTYLSGGGSQLAVVHGSDERMLLFKAAPFGGEHDHYDRLGIHFTAFGQPLSRDLGTAAGYSAPLHYAYFKNTASHNTVVIDGENMAPCATRVTKFERIADDEIYLSAVTETPESYGMLDSFTIKQWSDESYRGAVLERHIGWFDKYFIDVYKVKAPNGKRIEWVWHTDGETDVPTGAAALGAVSEHGAESHLTDARVMAGGGVLRTVYDAGECLLDIHSLTDGMSVIYAKGPDNPSVKDISYLLLRSEEREVVFASVIEAHRQGESVIEDVNITVDGGAARVIVAEKSGKIREFAR